MKQRFILSLVLFIFFVISSTVYANYQSNFSKTVYNKTSSPVDSSISIIDNNELLQYAINNSLQGNGQKSNPIIFENLNLISSNSNYQIEIQNTNLYVIIRNSTINFALKEGIFLQNVSNIILYGNSFKMNTGDAIYILSSSNIEIQNNTFTETKSAPTYSDPFGLQNYPFTIDVAYSDNVTIYNNNLHDNWDGIWFWGGDTNCKAINNTIYNHHFEGIGAGAYQSSHNITIANNSINNVRYGVWLVGDGGPTLVMNNNVINSSDGIIIQKTSFTTVKNNSFSFNLRTGISFLTDSQNISSSYNIIRNNSYGFYIVGSNLEIHYNDLINNTDSAFTISNDNINISYNFWSTYTNGSDNNNDGILDDPLKIDGIYDLYDNYPLVHSVFGNYTTINYSLTGITKESTTSSNFTDIAKVSITTSNSSQSSNLSFLITDPVLLISLSLMSLLIKRRKKSY